MNKPFSMTWTFLLCRLSQLSTKRPSSTTLPLMTWCTTTFWTECKAFYKEKISRSSFILLKRRKILTLQEHTWLRQFSKIRATNSSSNSNMTERNMILILMLEMTKRRKMINNSLTKHLSCLSRNNSPLEIKRLYSRLVQMRMMADRESRMAKKKMRESSLMMKMMANSMNKPKLK